MSITLLLHSYRIASGIAGAKSVSYKDITEAMQKAVQSIEGTKRQYREVLCNETILKYCANVFHCLRAWGLSA